MAKKTDEEKGILSKMKDKITNISGIITGICAITAFLWMVFKQVNSYDNVKNSNKAQAVQIDSLIMRVNVLEEELNNAKKSKNIDEFDLNTVYEIIAYNMPDYYYNGVRFKTSFDGQRYYYFVQGVLYKAVWNQENQKFSYVDEYGQSRWCE